MSGEIHRWVELEAQRALRAATDSCRAVAYTAATVQATRTKIHSTGSGQSEN